VVDLPRGPGVQAVQRLAYIVFANLRVVATWMFSCAPRSTFFLGGMLTVGYCSTERLRWGSTSGRLRDGRRARNCVGGGLVVPVLAR